MQCERMVIDGVRKGERKSRQCKRKAAQGKSFCGKHLKAVLNLKPFAGYGRGNGTVFNTMALWKAKMAGRVWDATDEVALLRTLLQICTEDLVAQPHWQIMLALPKLAMIAGEITKIGERHAKIEDGLKLKIEFNQLQDFVAFVVGLINSTVKDKEAKRSIAEALGSYIERLEGDD